MLPLPTVLRRRSSWPSSFVTALIGWNGFATLTVLALHGESLVPRLLLISSSCAVLQVLLLRARLHLAPRSPSVASGAIWGAVTAVLLVLVPATWVEALREHRGVALLVAGYIGAPVGAFLSYFQRDDARIEAAARAADRPIRYGRDAHWLDPFVYGAAAYLLVFMQGGLRSGAVAAIVGSMVGVVAAGVSHFFLSRLANAPITVLIAATAGAPLGAVTGLLLAASAPSPVPAPYAGAFAGTLCFAITAAVGRKLAVREKALAG